MVSCPITSRPNDHLRSAQMPSSLLWTARPQQYTHRCRCRHPRCGGDTRHLDEVFRTINGQRHYLWCAVDQDGIVLDTLVQCRGDKAAAKRYFRKLLRELM
jgi:putative transposase